MYAVDLPAEVRFSRLGMGGAMLLDYHPETVPAVPELPQLLARVVGGVASAEERAAFARLWQERVRRILLDHADDPALLSLRQVG